MAFNIIWQMASGSLVVTALRESATMGEAVAHKDDLIARNLFIPSQFISIVQSADLPQERYFRPAWRWGGAGVVFDLPACQQRHLQKLRKIRNRLLADSDSLVVRSMETNDTTRLNQLKAYRQSLRDMPVVAQQSFNTATTPEQIRAVRPAILDTPAP